MGVGRRATTGETAWVGDGIRTRWAFARVRGALPGMLAAMQHRARGANTRAPPHARNALKWVHSTGVVPAGAPRLVPGGGADAPTTLVVIPVRAGIQPQSGRTPRRAAPLCHPMEGREESIWSATHLHLKPHGRSDEDRLCTRRTFQFRKVRK